MFLLWSSRAHVAPVYDTVARSDQPWPDSSKVDQHDPARSGADVHAVLRTSRGLVKREPAASHRCDWRPSTPDARRAALLARSVVNVDVRWSVSARQDGSAAESHICVHIPSLRQTHQGSPL